MKNMYAVGDVINCFFRVESILGGGMGVVYICRVLPEETAEPIRVAVKSFPKDLYWGSGAAERFALEAQLWISLLPHPCIVRAETVMRLGGIFHLWLEYVEGGNLRSRLRGTPIEETETLRMALEFCEGMRFLFETAGVIHRDIKPENILLTRSGRIRITDFGIAKSLSGAALPREGRIGHEAVASEVNTGDQILGTPAYMSPEQFAAAHTLSPASDVYSFGIVLYEMITGHRPLNASSVAEWYGRHLFGQALSPSAVGNTPAALSAIVLKCLEKKPEKRFRDFVDLGAALEEYCHATRRAGLAPPKPSVQELEARMSPMLWFRRACALDVMGRHDDAFACFQRSLVVTPAPLGANAAYGGALARRGRHSEALAFYEKEAAQHPAGISFTQLATAYLDVARPNDALAASRKSVTVDGPVIGEDTLVRWREHAKLARKVGAQADYKNAIERIKELLSRDPFDDVTAVISTTIEFIRLDDWAAATTFHIMSIERFPQEAMSWYNFGVSLHKAGDHENAVDAYSRALNLDPHLPWALLARGLLYAIHNDPDTARTDWERALQVDPDHTVSKLVRIVEKEGWEKQQILGVAKALHGMLSGGKWIIPYEGFE
jgi:tetratricopeptide (TPR) repeat protein